MVGSDGTCACSAILCRFSFERPLRIRWTLGRIGGPFAAKISCLSMMEARDDAGGGE